MKYLRTEQLIITALFFATFVLLPNNYDVSIYKNSKIEEPPNNSERGIMYGYPSVFPLNEEDINWIEDTFEKMTLADKVAQMVMPWVHGKYLSRDSVGYNRLVNLVKNKKVGGLIFFQGEILNQALIINQMQELADVPLLISSDFERGLAMRLEDATSFPYNMALGATGKPEFAYKMGKIIADESRAIGVHQNYAPVADINNNAENPIVNIRAFSEDKNIVSEFCIQFIKGTNEGRVLSTAKHFPGHGDTKVDSHKDLPKINIPRDILLNNELIPFIHSISAGVHSIMIGHLEVPAYEPIPGLPATLSYSIITELLKNELGFDGIVVTDAMNMSGVTKYYSVAEASVMAIRAGNDILLMPPDEEVAINSIIEAIENGDIPIQQIDKSVRKILAAKKWLKLDEQKFVPIEEVTNIVGNKSHIELSEKIAEASVTLVKNDDDIIPINPKKIYRAVTITLSDANEVNKELQFAKGIEENFDIVTNIVLNRKSRNIDYSRALEAAKKANIILLPTFVKVRAFHGSVSLPAQHEKFINDILKLNIPTAFISFGNPYLLSLFPKTSTYLATYGDVFVSQNAALKAILGQIDIKGKLPVSIPKTTFAMGHGINIKKTVLLDTNVIFKNYDFTSVDNLLLNAVKDGVFPGAVALVGYKGNIIYHNAVGNFIYEESSVKMTTDAIFDLASVSKVVGTTSAAMMLVDEGKIALDDKVSKYLTGFEVNGKENITIRNLLLHNSGFVAWIPYYKKYSTKKEIIDDIMNQSLSYPTGTKMEYSDLGMITLQLVIEKVSGKSLDKFLEEKLFAPLKMYRTMYNPPAELWYYIPPTEVDDYWRNTTVKGIVHDETAAMLGGVAGHAGLFSTASDLAIYFQMMLQKGSYGGKKYFSSELIENWTTKQSDLSTRGLGWDTKSPNGSSAGSLFSNNSYGHTGFTGTSVWVDKERELFVILLSNRVYPTRENKKIISFRPKFHDTIINVIEKK